MIAILWRYRVKPEHRAAFEATYGPDGDWARLFRRHDHYLGTELLSSAPRRRPGSRPDEENAGEALAYLTIDRWRSEADCADFMATHRADYEALDAATEGWTEEEVRLGVWETPRCPKIR
jgi:hypothetical protein